MGVAIGDLDDFKDFNDHLGHHVGDLALQRVARLLNEHRWPSRTRPHSDRWHEEFRS